MLDLAARADEHDLGLLALRVDQHVCALGHAHRGPLCGCGEDGDLLAAEDEAGRAVLGTDDDPPRGGDLIGVGRADQAQAGHGPQRRQLLDGLVRGAVLADADRVVGPRVHDLRPADGGDPHRAAHVVAEDEERAAHREDAAMGRHPVHDSAHAVLADAEMDEAAFGRRAGERADTLDGRTGVASEVGAAADQFGDGGDERVEALAARGSGRNVLARLVHRKAGVPVGGEGAVDAGVELLATVAGRSDTVGPDAHKPGVAPSCGPVHGKDVGGNEEVLRRQTEDDLGLGDLLGAERLAVRGRRVHAGRGREADVAAETDEGRLVGDGHAPPQCGLERVEVVGDLADLVDIPAVRPEAHAGVVAIGQLRRAVDGDVVVVVDADQLAEPEMAGQRPRLMADALHEVAVAHDHEREVVAHVGAVSGPQVGLGYGHADGVGDALPERAGGDLDPRGVTELGMARRLRAELPERLEVVELESEAGEMQHRIQQDRRMAAGQHESVTVEPLRTVGVVVHDPGPQDVSEWRQRHRRAGMAAVRLLHRIHGEAPDHVDAKLLRPGGGLVGDGCCLVAHADLF